MLTLLSQLMLQAVSAPAQPAAAPPPPDCTAANSTRTEITAITGAPERFAGRCVTVSGPASGIAIYHGIEGVYLAGRYDRDGNISRTARRHRIGVYTIDGAVRAAAVGWRGPAALTVTGRVDTCERIAKRVARKDRKYGSISMLAGYCHYYPGPVVRASSYSIDTSRRYERLFGERARRRFGNLVALPNDWPTRPLLLTSAEAFRSAVAAGDRRALAELHGVSPDPDESDMLDYILNPNSSFRELRGRPAAQLALFAAFGTTGQPSADPAEIPGATVCFCRSSDCSNVWPISSADATNSADTPYVCTAIRPLDRAGREVRFSTPFDRVWLAEPAQTAFHRN